MNNISYDIFGILRPMQTQNPRREQQTPIPSMEFFSINLWCRLYRIQLFSAPWIRKLRIWGGRTGWQNIIAYFRHFISSPAKSEQACVCVCVSIVRCCSSATLWSISYVTLTHGRFWGQFTNLLPSQKFFLITESKRNIHINIIRIKECL